MLNVSGKYLGSINSERMAARVYDRCCIRANGLKAKTNFSYTKEQLLRMLTNETKPIEEVLTPAEREESVDEL